MPFNGDYYDSTGAVKNLLDLGEAPEGSPKERMQVFNGDFYASDGSIHNIDELGGGGGGEIADIINNSKRSFFRGKHLGEQPTPEQMAAIKDGSFTDLYLGDYWKKSNSSNTWRIWDFDYWYHAGPTNAAKTKVHHLVMMPDIFLYNQRMNPAGETTAFGFTGSELYATGLGGAWETANSDLGSSNLCQFLMSLPSKVNYMGILTDITSAWRSMIIPSIAMLFGSSASIPGSNYGLLNSESTTETPITYPTQYQKQLALARVKPEYLCTIGTDVLSAKYWLMDSISVMEWAVVLGTNGTLGRLTGSNSSCGLRPIVALGEQIF